MSGKHNAMGFLRPVVASTIAGLMVIALAPAASGQHVPFEATPAPVVNAMLRLARVGSSDVVADIGCGDGRIVIAAVRDRGARGVCIDHDPARLELARARAMQAGVADRIRFSAGEAVAVDLRQATVVTLFLSRELNVRLRPKLQAELPPGARVVSHWHDMGAWIPDRTEYVYSTGHTRPVHVWIIGR